jgi:hypothetical protein
MTSGDRGEPGRTGWTHAGAQLPWLRGHGFHLAELGTEELIGNTLAAAGFAIARATGWISTARYRPVAAALRLPVTAENNLDALADGLTELPERWPTVSRLALLWPESEALLHTDLLAWVELSSMLRAATDRLWASPAGRPVVLESVFFVRPASFGADHP